MFVLQFFNPVLFSLFLLMFNLPVATPTISYNHTNQQEVILAHAQGMHADALHYALRGHQWALSHGKVNKPNILTVIDFNLPSNQKRHRRI